jgi:serine protease Do
MFDLNGNVIGINTALISPTGGNVGLGFAIPAEQARPVVEALQRGQRPKRGYLGVSFQPIDENLAGALGVPKNQGTIIRSVTPGGPAARAGIEQGDIITRIDGRPVTEEERLAVLVATLPVGTRVPIELLRNGQRRTVTITVAERPSDEDLAKLTGAGEAPVAPVRPPAESQQTPGQRSTRQSLGITVQTLTPELRRSLNQNDPNLVGVVVSGIDPSSEAAQVGLQQRDVIISINQRPTRTPEEAAAAVEAARTAGRPSVSMLVKRGSNPPIYIGVMLNRR